MVSHWSKRLKLFLIIHFFFIFFLFFLSFQTAFITFFHEITCLYQSKQSESSRGSVIVSETSCPMSFLEVLALGRNLPML